MTRSPRPAMPSRQSSEESPQGGLVHLPLDQIVPDPDQPRKMGVLQQASGDEFDRFFGGAEVYPGPTRATPDADVDRDLAKIPDTDALSDLAEDASSLTDSIIAQGVIQPILVSRIGKDRYRIIAGERRWTAARKATERLKSGLPAPAPRPDYDYDRIPALIVETSDGSQRLEIQLVENIQRFGMNYRDIGAALLRLKTEKKYTILQLAQRIGKSGGFVQNALAAISLDGQSLSRRLDSEDWYAIRRMIALRKSNCEVYDWVLRRVEAGERFSRDLIVETIDHHRYAQEGIERDQMEAEFREPTMADYDPEPPLPDFDDGMARRRPRIDIPRKPKELEAQLYQSRSANYATDIEEGAGPATLLIRRDYQKHIRADDSRHVPLIAFKFRLPHDEAARLAAVLRAIEKSGLSENVKPSAGDWAIAAEELVLRLRALLVPYK